MNGRYLYLCSLQSELAILGPRRKLGSCPSSQTPSIHTRAINSLRLARTHIQTERTGSLRTCTVETWVHERRVEGIFMRLPSSALIVFFSLFLLSRTDVVFCLLPRTYTSEKNRRSRPKSAGHGEARALKKEMYNNSIGVRARLLPLRPPNSL
ncbi:hypothetical protein EDD21DRAFT_365299, partial [Dissophora ornata]